MSCRLSRFYDDPHDGFLIGLGGIDYASVVGRILQHTLVGGLR